MFSLANEKLFTVRILYSYHLSQTYKYKIVSPYCHWLLLSLLKSKFVFFFFDFEMFVGKIYILSTSLNTPRAIRIIYFWIWLVICHWRKRFSFCICLLSMEMRRSWQWIYIERERETFIRVNIECRLLYLILRLCLLNHFLI